MFEKFKDLVDLVDFHLELRFHRRVISNLSIKNGSLRDASSSELRGVGIRALKDGSWGFAATSDLSYQSLKTSALEAGKAAQKAAAASSDKIEGLASAEMARGDFKTYSESAEYEPELAEKIDTLLTCDKKIRESDELVEGSAVGFTEQINKKYIFTSDGAKAEVKDKKADISLNAFGGRSGRQEKAKVSKSITGDWNKLFSDKSLRQMRVDVINILKEKFKAERIEGGIYKVILDPALVGVLAHEAIGHTVEADFVKSGSAARGKIGEVVASDLITMVDDGGLCDASGKILVDDEGVKAEETVIIENGVMKNYLHNRQTAYEFSAEPGGNARAYNYNDEPLIRMTNTYIKPGDDELENMISEIDEGLYLKGLGEGGQADSTAEFMFDVERAYKIKDGEIDRPVKGVTITGQAYDVLKSVDAISEEFEIGLGRGYCGKWQRAKVDAGGPYLRCEVKVGGKNSG